MEKIDQILDSLYDIVIEPMDKCNKMKETELAKKFIDYLSCYDLYFEIPTRNVDIVAKSGILLMAFEVKTMLNFKVIEQAFYNIQYFHYSYICVPNPKGNIGFQQRICEKFGIGILGHNEIMGVRELCKPRLNRKALTKYVKLPEYSKRSIAGAPSNSGTTITAFKHTIDNMEKYIRRHPGCSLKECISEVSHHYGSESTAIASIYKWLNNGVITEFQLINGKLNPTI